MSERREPILNLPNVVTALILLMGLVHFVRSKLVSEELDLEFLATFAFIPVRYLLPAAEDPFPGGTAAEVADFVTYAFIHGDWTHFLVNAVWLAAFGSAVAWRFGALRFLAFSAITAAAAAGTHMLTHWGEAVPLVGASGAISGHMAAAVRFVFVERGPLGAIRGQGPARFRRPAISLARAFLDRRALAMIVAFFAVNFLFGSISLPMMGEDQVMAWEAHLGGFVSGLVLFRFFDPVGTGVPPAEGDGEAVEDWPQPYDVEIVEPDNSPPPQAPAPWRDPL